MQTIVKDREERSNEEEAKKVSDLKGCMLDKLTELCKRSGLIFGGKPAVTMLSSLLSRNHCERRISHLLQNPTLLSRKGEPDFDSIYREKSEYATGLIVDHLKTRLLQEGYKVSIATESKSDFSVADVMIETGNPCKIFHQGIEKIVIEVKASLGIPLEQIGRYLLDGSTLIVGRIITNHAFMLKPSYHHNFVEFSLKEMISKSERLLQDSPISVPGKYCKSCMDFECPFNKNKGFTTDSKLITVSSDSIQREMDSFFGNLSEVSRKIATLVLEELKASSPVQDSVIHCKSCNCHSEGRCVERNCGCICCLEGGVTRKNRGMSKATLD